MADDSDFTPIEDGGSVITTVASAYGEGAYGEGPYGGDSTVTIGFIETQWTDIDTP